MRIGAEARWRAEGVRGWLEVMGVAG